MSVLPHTGVRAVRAASIVTLSSSIGTFPPATRDVASKEALEASTEGSIEVTRPTIPIYANTQCFIYKSIEVTWNDIKDTFMQKQFAKNLEDLEVYINIKRSRAHRIACRFPVILCVEVIEWILTHMDGSHLMLHSESGG